VKVLLDEMLPAGVSGLLTEHEVTTVRQAGFTGLANGELIRRATAAGFQVLLTADRNHEPQVSSGSGRRCIGTSWTPTGTGQPPACR
jgi:hypothetical protein